MASQAKKVPLKSEVDFAIAVTAPPVLKEQLLRSAIRKGGYQYYIGFRTAAPAILNVATALLPSTSVTKAQAKAIIESACINAHDELDNNLHLDGAQPGQDPEGRLWDVLWMFRASIKRSNGADTILYQLYVALPDRGDWQSNEQVPERGSSLRRETHRLVTLKALCHPGDDPAPVITIMLPDED